MKKHIIQVVYWLALTLPQALPGQSSVLDQYVTQALANNLSLRSIDLDQRQQLSRIDQAKKHWSPNVDLNTSYLLANGGRKIVFPVGDLFNPVYTTLNQLTATQNFPEDLENFETQLTPNNFLDASLSVSKPIINSAIKYNIKIQQALLQLSDVDRALQNTEITFQVKQAYYNYLKTIHGVNVLNENQSLLNEVLRFNQKLIKYDKATPDIISDVEFQLASIESQIDELEEQQSLSRILFNTILNRDISEELVIDTSVFKNLNTTSSNLNVLIGKALGQRSEFIKLVVADEINNLDSKRIQSENLPIVGVQGGVGLQTEDFSLNDGGPLYTLGLSLGWNIFDGGLRKKKLEELQIEREQNALQNEILKQQITLQVSQAFHNLEALYARLAAQDAQISAARISYNAINAKYKNEKALLIELLTAQNKLTASRLNRVLLVIDILIGQADMERIINEAP